MTDTKVATSPEDDPAEAAKQGFDDLMAGKDHAVAGTVKNKVRAAVGRVVPDPLKAKAQSEQTEPGSGNLTRMTRVERGSPVAADENDPEGGYATAGWVVSEYLHP